MSELQWGKGESQTAWRAYSDGPEDRPGSPRGSNALRSAPTSSIHPILPEFRPVRSKLSATPAPFLVGVEARRSASLKTPLNPDRFADESAFDQLRTVRFSSVPTHCQKIAHYLIGMVF
jgi:hypothetical protein